GPRYRQHEAEAGALVDFALHLDLSAVRGDDAMADGEPERGALAHGLGGEERAEDLVQVLARDAYAGVGHGEGHRIAAFPPRLDLDPPPGRRGVEGVHEEGEQGLAQLALVRGHARK